MTMATDSKRSESVGNSSNSKRISGQRHLSDPAAYDPGEPHGQHGNQDPDLFAILSSMHLTNQLNSLGNQSTTAQIISAMPHPVLVASRKRKILDGGGHAGFR